MLVPHARLIGAVLAVIAFVSTPGAFAQSTPSGEALVLREPVTRDVGPGNPHWFSIRVRSGDYVDGSITPLGTVTVTVRSPDGSVLRSFHAAGAEGKQSFAFAAEAVGDYKLEIIADRTPAHYELRIDAIAGLDERLRPEPWTDPNPSPRMEALRRQVLAGNTDTSDFWNKARAEGTPLIEPFAANGRYRLVTFLWRATYETRSVFVRSPLRLPETPPSHYAMHRLADTDVWYLTLKIPAGARFDYQISPNDPLVFDGPRAGQRRVTSQADPLNPHRWGCGPDGGRFSCHSYAELPGAAPQPWFERRPGTPEGHVETRRFHSDIQKLDRTIAIYTPAGYGTTERPNHVLVLFDADDFLDEDTALPTTLDNLLAASRIPATVAVMVFNVRGRRLEDLLLNQEFADSMANELVPWVRTRYNVSKDAAETIVAGHSAGGVGAVYMALRHPEVFGNVLSQSGAVWWSPEMDLGNQDATDEPNWLARQFIHSPKSAVRFFLSAGTFEVDTGGRGSGILEANRQLRDVLLARGYDVHYQQFVGGHDTVSWRGTIADGLLALGGNEKKR